ncbi:MAG: ATPase [Candidatus Altiarchaeales archaeon]|nr:ATPase [Candidatus Altiarchaeales archaeon]
MEKCPTGILGLDELLEGGFPRGRVILLSGECGTGKSIFGVQFIYNGIVKYNEPGIIVSLEQDPEQYKEDMLSMGIDLKKLEDNGKLIIIDASLAGLNLQRMISQKGKDHFKITPEQFSIESMISLIEEAVKMIGAKRVVIDSFSALDPILEARKSRVGMDLRQDIRRTILGINYKLQEMKLTSILISEMVDHKLSTHGVEEFMVDGVIILHYTTAGPDAGRHLTVKKMRMVRHSEHIHQIAFETRIGVKVLKA